MSILKGKNIVLGITGSIAAYKAAALTRLLVKKGANVKVIMTKLAKEFITPLTMATLSKNPIMVEFYNPENGDWNSHVDTGLWADLLLIAPATANTMGKMANGIADNLLITTYLSAKCPVMIAPAMDLDMYRHPSTQRNMDTLRSYGNVFIEPGSGELASGLIGKGRMAEPEEIVEHMESFLLLNTDLPLSGKKVLITAGPTHEAIDPVRFIGNHSSGKMGYALAISFIEQGAEVTLISGPVSLPTPKGLFKQIDVISADDMYQEATFLSKHMDIIVSCAAVADFTPEEVQKQKVKRGEDDLVIHLKPTKDIAAELGRQKKEGQILVGFALETQNELENAQSKMHRKNLDLIVLNSLNDKGAGFAVDTNKVTLLTKDGKSEEISLKQKGEVADDIVKYLLSSCPFNK